MKAKIKAKWIAALRGGNFKQGMRALRKANDSCCCLGVLADICGATWRLNTNSDVYEFGCEWGSSRTIIPPTFRRRIGLTATDQETLINLNDGGATFNEIADWIEQNL